jgi:hypothetical protein
MAVVAVMLLSVVHPGEAQAGKALDGADKGGPKGVVVQVSRAVEGDRNSRGDGSGDASNGDRRMPKTSIPVGGEKDLERGAPSQMAGASAFSTTEINAIGLLSAFSIFAGALGLVELFRRNAA